MKKKQLKKSWTIRVGVLENWEIRQLIYVLAEICKRIVQLFAIANKVALTVILDKTTVAKKN